MGHKFTKASFEYLAKEAAGLEFEVSTGYRRPSGEVVGWSITLDAPKGKIFRGSFCHVDCSLQGPTPAVDWDLACRGLREILEDGFEDCAEEGCEVCAEASE